MCLTHICSLFLIRAFARAVGDPDLSTLLLSVCQLCCGSPFPHGVNIYWASMCKTPFQAHQDSRWGCSPPPAGRLGGFELELWCLKLESKNEVRAEGEREHWGSKMFVHHGCLSKGAWGGYDRDPKNYKQLLRAGRQGWARHTAEEGAPAQAGLLPIPEGLLGPDSCQGLRLEWMMSTTLFNTQFSNLCAQRNMPSWTTSLAPKCCWNRQESNFPHYKTSMWLTWCGSVVDPWTKRSSVQFPFRAHAQVEGLNPSWGYAEGSN